MPPRLWLRLCTQPRPFWNAIAPCMLALIMLQRASRSLPSRVARSMCAQARSRPSSAMPSAGGLTAGAMKVSMQCAIASMPVAAVSAGGRPSVSSGSQIAVLRHQVPAVEAELAAVVDDDDRAARDLAAGAGGGRHRDQRRAPVGDLRAAAFDGGVGLERAIVRRRDRDALGADRCSSRRRRAIRPSQCSSRNTLVAARTAASVGLDGVSSYTACGMAPSAATRAVEQAGGAHAGVGDDQRLA